MTLKMDAKCHAIFVASLTALLLISNLGVIQAGKLDSEKPTQFEAFTIFSPLNTTYSSRHLTLNLTFQSFWMKYLLNYDIDGKHQGEIPYKVINNGETHIMYPAVATVNLPPLPDGPHSITVHLYATQLKTRNPEFDGTVYFTIDPDNKLTPLSIENLSIQEITYNTSDLPLQFTSNKNIIEAIYNLDGKNNVTFNGNGTLTGLTDGSHNLTLYMQDKWGGTTSQTINFTVALPKPVATQQPQTFPTASAALGLTITLAVASACILIIAKKARAKLKQP